MKKENAMSHKTFVICIAVIIIATAIMMNILLNETKNMTLENLITDMLLVQGKIKVIDQQNIINEEQNPLLGKKVSENLEDEIIKNLINNGVLNQESENFDKYYIITQEDLSQMKLENKLNGDCYVVNYANYEIIYPEGIKIDNEMHYTLTELLEHRNKLNSQEDKNEVNNTDEINENSDNQ